MKIVSIFSNDKDLKELIHGLNTAGINNVHIRPLSSNYQQEAMEEVLISRNEKYGLLIGILSGATIGSIISYLMGIDILIMPLLLRVEAAGKIAVNFFWIMITTILGGFLGALTGLAINNSPGKTEDKMVIVYCNTEERPAAISIINTYGGQVL